MNPIVSVVIPFYSQKGWLVEALESVLKQTFKNYEIIVINDGSEENIDDIKKIYRNKVNFIYQENGGPAKARNTGIVKSKGKYVAFLDSDDFWTPNKLEEQVNYMEKESLIWTQHSYTMFDDENRNKQKKIDTSKAKGNVLKQLYISFKVQTSTVMVLRKFLIDNEIFFPESERFGQDISFLKKIAREACLGHVEGYYSFFRIRGTNAGFNPITQLEHRAKNSTEINNSFELNKLIPKSIKFAYFMAENNYAFFKKITDSDKKKQGNRIVAYILYAPSYTVFKLYDKLVNQ